MLAEQYNTVGWSAHAAPLSQTDPHPSRCYWARFVFRPSWQTVNLLNSATFPRIAFRSSTAHCHLLFSTVVVPRYPFHGGRHTALRISFTRRNVERNHDHRVPSPSSGCETWSREEHTIVSLLIPEDDAAFFSFCVASGLQIILRLHDRICRIISLDA